MFSPDVYRRRLERELKPERVDDLLKVVDLACKEFSNTHTMNGEVIVSAIKRANGEG